MAKKPVVLWGYTEVASHAGVTASVVRQWKVRGHLPEPEFLLSGSPGWKAATIERWWAARVSSALAGNRSSS